MDLKNESYVKEHKSDFCETEEINKSVQTPNRLAGVDDLCILEPNKAVELKEATPNAA